MTMDELCEAHLDILGPEIAGIGISDHLFRTPSSHAVDERQFASVFEKETRRYVGEVHAARSRWAGRLSVYCGCEINWPLNRNMLPLIQTMLRGIDYVLFEGLNWAALTELANQARRWPCSIGLAHTEVAESFPKTSPDQVVRTLANAKIFYEISATLWPIESQRHWYGILPRHRVLVSLGTDTHDDVSVLKRLPQMRDFAAECGLADKFFVPRINSGAAA
jgi:hypothetical protein